MDNRPDRAFSEDFAAALGWWREAGVDCDFADEAQGWLADADGKPSEKAPARTGGDLVAPAEAPDDARGTRLRGDAGIGDPAFTADTLPTDLAAFHSWWLTEPLLDAGRISDRIPPRGTIGAKLMVLVPHPEREDSADAGGRLLANAQGRLLDAFLSAAGISDDDVYVASVLPRHTPQADWPGIAARNFGAVLARHVLLASPRRLVALGGNISPLLSNDPAKNPADLREFNHESGTIPLLADRDLAVLLERPGWKARFWSRWLEWIG